MGAYFLKKQARSPILEGFGRNIYALLSFSGQQYSEEEIDRKLTEYFATHPVLTRTNMQSLCSFTQSMASRQIRRLKAEGKLQNIGKPTQPIYVAGTGYYEK